MDKYMKKIILCFLLTALFSGSSLIARTIGIAEDGDMASPAQTAPIAAPASQPESFGPSSAEVNEWSLQRQVNDNAASSAAIDPSDYSSGAGHVSKPISTATKPGSSSSAGAAGPTGPAGALGAASGALSGGGGGAGSIMSSLGSKISGMFSNGLIGFVMQALGSLGKGIMSMVGLGGLADKIGGMLGNIVSNPIANNIGELMPGTKVELTSANIPGLTGTEEGVVVSNHGQVIVRIPQVKNQANEPYKGPLPINYQVGVLKLPAGGGGMQSAGTKVSNVAQQAAGAAKNAATQKASALAGGAAPTGFAAVGNSFSKIFEGAANFMFGEKSMFKGTSK
jgi:hypothetical protein